MKKCESWQEVVASVEDDVHLLCCHLEVQVWLKLPFSPYQKPSHDESIIQFKNLSSRFWPDVKKTLPSSGVPWKVVSIYSRLFKAAPTIVAPNFFVEAGRPGSNCSPRGLLGSRQEGLPRTRGSSLDLDCVVPAVGSFVRHIVSCYFDLHIHVGHTSTFLRGRKTQKWFSAVDFFCCIRHKKNKNNLMPTGTTFNRSCSVAVHFWTPECRSWPSVSPHGHL